MSWNTGQQVIRGYLTQGYAIAGGRQYGNSGGYNATWVFWSSYGWWDAKTIEVSFGTIMSLYSDGKSSVTIDMGMASYTVFFVFGSNATASAALASLNSNTGYSVTMGQSLIQATQAMRNDVFGFVASIITFSPGKYSTGDPWIDFMISSAIDVCILWIAFWAVTRILGSIIP